MTVLLACLPVRHMCPWSLRKPEEGMDAVELELQTVSSHHVGAGNETMVLSKSIPCS